jgi:pimeloyl-ACP methyl ester carboxylesterase
VVGHSAGGVVAYLFAHTYPDLVASVVSVEGNFTLKDAFWSAAIARMPEAEVKAMLDRFRNDRAAWLAQDGIAATPETLGAAAAALSQQPASTVRAMARAVVETTSPPRYEALLRTVFSRTPVHLVAGERSRVGWDTPPWALEQAAGVTVMPAVGHLMTWENPSGFGALIAELLAEPTTQQRL